MNSPSLIISYLLPSESDGVDSAGVVEASAGVR